MVLAGQQNSGLLEGLRLVKQWGPRWSWRISAGPPCRPNVSPARL